MSTLPPGLSQEQINRYAKLDAGIKLLQDEKDNLNNVIKDAHKDQPRGTYIYESVVVKIGETSKVDTKGIEGEFPFEVNPEYYDAKLDAKKVPAETKARYTTKVPTLSVSIAG